MTEHGVFALGADNGYEQLIHQWVAALRSGEYTQTTGALHNEHGYCCLGVADEVCFGAIWKMNSGARQYNDDQDRSGTLSEERARALGLLKIMPEDQGEQIIRRFKLPTYEVRGKTIIDVAVNMNDGGSTFEDIAEMVEYVLLGKELKKAE